MSDEENKAGASEETASAAAPSPETAEPATDAATNAAEASAADAVAKLQAENTELKEKYLRLYADQENLRKRLEREKNDIAKYAISEFAREIIPLSDNLQRAISAVSPEAAAQDEALQSFLDGIELTERELQKVLERHGVVKIDPKGEKADPNLHHVVQQLEDPSLPHNSVCDVYQVGYMIADRVLRPAMVAVSKGGPREPAAAAATAEPAQEPAAEPTAGTEPAAEQHNEDPGSHVDKSV